MPIHELNIDSSINFDNTLDLHMTIIFDSFEGISVLLNSIYFVNSHFISSYRRLKISIKLFQLIFEGKTKIRIINSWHLKSKHKTIKKKVSDSSITEWNEKLLSGRKLHVNCARVGNVLIKFPLWKSVDQPTQCLQNAFQLI